MNRSFEREHRAFEFEADRVAMSSWSAADFGPPGGTNAGFQEPGTSARIELPEDRGGY